LAVYRESFPRPLSRPTARTRCGWRLLVPWRGCICPFPCATLRTFAERSQQAAAGGRAATVRHSCRRHARCTGGAAGAAGCMAARALPAWRCPGTAAAAGSRWRKARGGASRAISRHRGRRGAALWATTVRRRRRRWQCLRCRSRLSAIGRRNDTAAQQRGRARQHRPQQRRATQERRRRTSTACCWRRQRRAHVRGRRRAGRLCQQRHGRRRRVGRAG
jgi:hypothetical protein